MAEIGATGSTLTSGPSPFVPVAGQDPSEEVLPSQYLINVQNAMFESGAITGVQRKCIPSFIVLR